ncbi:hypothetical protein SAMN04487902_101549 [Prevotella sp. ne3005]|uniref:beta strand repeat-containing protein n=1 Tax=Prevotella sp. ne3005 TaxID=1761887 RepID=UPI0008BCEECB|nr:hypothetical protein [Prevotella sp. ne3005]SEM57609.1 hypothetical protein SAMN04487902_101549 [Prevotella sp. ne3005]
MRKLLLNPTPLFRKLRQLSMLLTLLLVPLGALGQTITVAGISPDGQTGAIEGANITGTVSYNSSSNTLTMTGATINGNITWTGAGNNPDLTIQMSGKNTVNGDIGSTNAAATCSLHIKKITDAESATLKYTGSISRFITDPDTGFKQFDITDGNTTYHYYTTAAVYELMVGGIQVHNIESELGYKDNIFQNNGTPTATFDGTNIITLNGATLTNKISWKADNNLTIKINGENSIPYISYDGNGTTAPQISFTAGGENCSLILNGNGLITGFYNDDAPTMIGLYWIPTWNNGSITSATITNSILGGGAGTEGSPFIISTFEHLKTFATYVNNDILSTEYIKLGGNIDCTNQTGFEPIGNNNKSFVGTFDGDKKTITGLIFSATNPDGVAGLFGNIGRINQNTDVITRGTVKNLTLNSCQFGNGNRNGAIAGYLNYGTIENCTVTSCTISSGNSQSTNSGGITGMVFNGVVKDCTVNGGVITSSTTDSNNGDVVAGGIAGYVYGGSEINGCTVTDVEINSTCNLNGNGHNSYSGGIVGWDEDNSGSFPVISGNSVTGTTTVNSADNVGDNDNKSHAGAILGLDKDESFTNISSNYYDKTVSTSTKEGDAAAEVKSGQTERGIGSNSSGNGISDEIGKVELAGTKKITITPSLIGGESHAKEGTYYLSVDNQSNNTYDVYALPGNEVGINATPIEGYKPRLTLSDVNINVASEEIKNNGAYDHTEFTFTMPDADLTANVDWDELYNLWIGDTQVTSNNAAHILGENNTTVTFTAADPNLQTSANTLTLNGATLTVPVKVGLARLTIDIKGTNSITTNTTCIQNVSAKVVPSLTFKSTSDVVGNLTLKNTDDSNTGVISSGFSGNFTISNELTLLTSGNYTLSDGEVHEAQLVPFYGVQVGETLVHAGNATDVLGDGTISFNKNTSTLTLNNANAGALSTSLAQLTVELVGDNTISAGDDPAFQSSSGNAVLISIQSTAEEKGNLTMNCNTGGSFFGNHVTLHVINPLDVVSGSLTGSGTVIIGEYYNLDVAGTMVSFLNKDNVLGDNKITFTPSSNTLTLNGATIGDGGINYRGETDFTIALNGSNSIVNTGGTAAIFANTQTTYSFNFVKATGASSAELSLKWGSGNIAISAERPTLGSGLYWKPIEETTLIITDDPEFIIIDDYAMTDTRTTINGTSGTITYNPTDKVLTLNGFTKEFGAKHAIKTGVTGLKVKLTGESTINCAADSTVFYAFSSSASIQFVKVDATSKLNMVGTAIDKFADGSVTYDGLVLYSDNYIAIPEPPTMALNSNDKVELTITYSGGTIATKYSIDYADETADVTNATYSDPFEMAAPGTVTAWVEANGTTTSTVKGKHFGYESKTFTMKSGETKAVVLAPAIEASDNIALADNPYASDAEGVATLSAGETAPNAVINAISIGKANLSTTLANTNAQEHTVILNKDNKFTIEVNVGAIMEGITFAPNMLYATYCNTTDKNMTVPEGLTAYAVTGTEGNNVTTEVVEFLPMNVPLLLMRSNASTEVGMSLVYDGTATAPATNILNFTNSDLTTTGKEYVLYNDEFVKATSTIRQNHCYLFITNPAPTRGYYSIGNGNDGSTAIDDTLIDNEETTNDDWYDLQGRRIQKPTKAGIYIVNGKKMIVK